MQSSGVMKVVCVDRAAWFPHLADDNTQDRCDEGWK